MKRTGSAVKKQGERNVEQTFQDNEISAEMYTPEFFKNSAHAEDPQKAQKIARELQDKYEKQLQRWIDYRNLFMFILFVALYLGVLYSQRNAQTAYQVHSTLSTVVPGVLFMDTSRATLLWVKTFLKNIWKDPACGDGVCESPFEFASYGRFGCRADCGRLSEVQNLTSIQIDLYYDFDHPATSIPSADLMTQASWNLCPKGGAPHGKDCYYQSDQKFVSLKGEVHAILHDVPDGQWQIQLKRDFFNKVRGAVRIVDKVKEQATWDKKYGAYMAARASQDYEISVLKDAINVANTTTFQYTVDKVLKTFNEKYEDNLDSFMAGSFDETEYSEANSSIDAEKLLFTEQYQKSRCRCADLGVAINFEEGTCTGTPEPLATETMEGITLSEIETCEKYKNLTDESIAERAEVVRHKLSVGRLGSQGSGGRIGARSTKKAEIKSYILESKPEVYDWVFTNPVSQSPEKDSNFTETKFDVLAKYFAEGPSAYLEPVLLSAQLKLSTRLVKNSSLSTLLENAEGRLQEILQQQAEVRELAPIQDMVTLRSLIDVNYTKHPLPSFIPYNYVAWDGNNEEYLICNLENRAPKYVGNCVTKVSCSRENDTAPFTCPERSDLSAEDCDIGCNRQKDCQAVCECSGSSAMCLEEEICVCEVCMDLKVASDTDEFRSIADIATGGGSASGLTGGRRMSRRLQANGTEEQLTDILDGVKSLRAGQDGLQSQVVSLEKEVQRANSLADERAKDDSLEKIIEQGRQEVATGQEKVETMLSEILGKQNEALKAAEDARNTVQALEDLAIRAAQAQEIVDRAIQEQLTTIKLASQQNLINLAQALELWKHARRERLIANKKAELANRRCSSSMIVKHDFQVENYDEEDAKTSRERHIGLTNRVIAGMLLYTTRSRIVKCSESRFTAVENECSEGLSKQSYGVDPAFKLGTSLFSADLDNEESMVYYYNCSTLNFATYDLPDPYSKAERYLNREPFCAELFNMRGVPYGFRSFLLEGKDPGFPVFFDINLSEAEAKKWFSYLEEGLFLDGETRSLTAELVTYNSELRIFGYLRVTFTFTDGGSIKVTHKLHTLKVELYETAADYVRFTCEVVWSFSVLLWLILDVYTILHNRKKTESLLKPFTSLWVWTDLVSNVLMGLSVFMWWIFVLSYARPFNIQLRYNVYDSLSPSAGYLKLLEQGSQLHALNTDFKGMQDLVDMLAWYYALNGINILLLIARLLKKMDFQPRLGVVTRSLALAGPDLIHFSLVSGMVFVGYAMMAHLIFGNAIEGFSTFGKAVNTCFEILLGEIGVNEELKALSGLQSLAGILFFWSFELLVFMVLLNFLLAIIVDAFSEVKGSTADMTGMHTEIAQMIGIKWQNFKGWLTNKNHISETKMVEILKQWAGDIQEEAPLIGTEIPQEKKLRVFGEDLDAETLKDILQQCLMDIPPLAKTKSFFSFGRGKVAHQLPTENEIDRAAEYVIDRFGHLPGESEDEEDENGSNDQEEESCKVNHNVMFETAAALEMEREKLAMALERLADVQRDLAEGQHNLMVGQKKLSHQQGKLVDLLNHAPSNS